MWKSGPSTQGGPSTPQPVATVVPKLAARAVVYNAISKAIKHYLSILGCPSLTFFFENKKVQPIFVVFGGWFKGSLKDFWFGQVLGGAQDCQKFD